MHILPEPHINMLYVFFKWKRKEGYVLYFVLSTHTVWSRGGRYGKNIISRLFLEISRFFVMLVLLFCKLSEHYSQTNFPIIKTKPFENKKTK